MAPQTRKRNRSKRDDESDPSTEQQEPQGNKKVKINIAKNNKSSSAPTAHPPLPSPASPPNAIPCTKKPTISQSSTEQPSTEQPSTEQPSTKESSTDKPPTEQVKKTFKRPESLWVPTNGERETYIYGTRNGTDVLDLSTMREVVGHVPFINGQYPFWLKDLVVDHQFFSKRDELEELMAKGHETVTTLEKVFDVPEGVNVFDKLKSLKTRPENDDIIESVLAFATHQMVFADKFAFPGEKIMREIIRHAVGYDEVTDMFIQDYRHRTVLKCPKFAEQKEALIQEYHKKLNTLMFHFVGGSTETSKAHRSIALSAVNANIKMASFVGYTQRPIWARSGADFDPALHAVEMEEAEIGVKKDHSGQKILLTRAFGVERKIPNGAWFTVIKAYVILFEK